MLVCLSSLIAAAASASVISGTARVNGTSLYYDMRGSGPTVILIHGGQLDRRMWDPQFELFARGHHVIRYDVRGYGLSGPADQPHQAHEDLFALMKELRVDRASLVGLSLGGRIAIDFALVHPGRVEALILAGPGLSGFPWSNDSSSWSDKLERAIKAGDRLKAAQSWLESDYMLPAMEHPDLAPRLRHLAIENGRVWTDKNSERELSPPAYGRLSEIQAPTLIIVGSRDIPDIHRIVSRLASNIRGARTVEIKGAGHMVNMENPKEFDAAVLGFLPR